MKETLLKNLREIAILHSNLKEDADLWESDIAEIIELILSESVEKDFAPIEFGNIGYIVSERWEVAISNKFLEFGADASFEHGEFYSYETETYYPFVVVNANEQCYILLSTYKTMKTLAHAEPIF